MIEKMLEKTKQYLEKTLLLSEKYLLGLSGGPDSMALFHLLLKGGWNFEVCHTDHGWRTESFEEAESLRELAARNGVPFHLDVISSKDFDVGNLEDICRRKRLSFFNKIYISGGFSALLLGHQADDNVETILKRVFEGSSLSNISAMKQDSIYEGMRVLRPLLDIFKEEILKYLNLNELNYFKDSTNLDPQFLRVRMRQQMLPFLEESFGKGMKENILLLGKRVEECMHYVHSHVNHKISHVKTGPLGNYLPISHLMDPFEGESIIRAMLRVRKIDISRGEMERLLNFIKLGGNLKKIVKGNWSLVVERDHFFIIRERELPSFSLSPLTLYRAPDDWRAIWSGESAVFLPSSDCKLGPPKLSAKMKNGMILKEWYRIHRVPAFLRLQVPVVWEGDRLVSECLTGKSCELNGSVYANHLLTLK